MQLGQSDEGKAFSNNWNFGLGSQQVEIKLGTLWEALLMSAQGIVET